MSTFERLSDVKDNLSILIRKSCEKMWDISPKVRLERPGAEGVGDLATAVSMELARRLKRPPIEIAETIAEEAGLPGDIVVKAEVAPPGFLNLHLKKEIWPALLGNELRQPHSFTPRKSASPMTYNMEFVSANPTGPLNVVNGRSGAVGDCLCRLLAARGHRVQREYYVNDAGRQADLLGESVLAGARRLQGEEAPPPEGGYGGSYIEELAITLEAKPEDDPKVLAQKAMKIMLARHKATLERYGVSFDSWFRESALHASGAVDKVSRELIEGGHTYEKEGALFFSSSKLGDGRDRVLRRSGKEARPTYLVPDMAYQRDKLARGADIAVTLLGPDHQAQVPSLHAGAQALGVEPDKLKFLIVQQVNLISEGKKQKMGKRLGVFVTLDEVLDKVGRDAARWFFAARALETAMDFDLDLAQLQTNENPVYYVQYGHARICSIFREYSKANPDSAKDMGNDAHLADVLESEAGLMLMDSNEQETLLKMILDYPQAVEEASDAFQPHRICGFLLELGSKFHAFYNAHRILGSGSMEAPRLALAAAAGKVFRHGLGLLAINAPERM